MAVKYLRVTMPDGSQWDIEAKVIADNRAQYYADQEDPEDPAAQHEVYKEEFEYAMGDDSELLDWAPNNMDWADVEHVAVRHHPPDEDTYGDAWCNAPKEIVEAD